MLKFLQLLGLVANMHQRKGFFFVILIQSVTLLKLLKHPQLSSLADGGTLNILHPYKLLYIHRYSDVILTVSHKHAHT